MKFDTLVSKLSEFFGLECEDVRFKLESDIISGRDVTSKDSNSYWLYKGLLEKYDYSDNACTLLCGILMV